MLCEAQFVRARFGAGEEVGPEFETERTRKGPGDELGLVVAAFAKAGGVERYWDDDIRGELFRVAGGEFGKAVREPGGKGSDTVVFYEKNCADHRVIVVGEASSEAEAIGSCAAEAAEKLGRVRDLK
jgi:hypothetical protein